MLVLVRIPLVIGLLSLLAACATSTPGGERSYARVEQAKLLDGSLMGLENPNLAEYPNILALNDDMRTFLNAHIEPGWGSVVKVEKILAAILDDGLRLDYNLFETHTAQEAFYTREGNCMSFTNLFVALARASGVTAYYQEVDVPPSWEASGNTWLYNKHLNAMVDLPGTTMMVDFAVDVVDTEHRRRVIDDEEAQARYHNNMGVHYLSENELEESFRHFRRALQLAPRTAYFWTNLGTLYRRLELYDAAEESFLIAVNISAEPAAMSNLARLYRRQGPQELAQWYEGKVQVFRRKNPYYMYSLAQQAYMAGEYDVALQEIRLAINRQEGVSRFHHLQGMSHLRMGNLEAAEEQFALAAEVAQDERERATYNRKLELLAKR